MNAKRKRNEAEQALWDQIEAEKQTLRRLKGDLRDRESALLGISSAAAEEVGIDLLRKYVVARDKVFSVESKIGDLEAKYRKLREKGES